MILALARMNPVTIGHEKAVEKLRNIAKNKNADHTLLVTHSHDFSKNPLTPEDKLKHLKRAFPDTNIHMTKKGYGIVDHLNYLHDQGYTHVSFIAGQDRIKDYSELSKKYNKEGKFKSIKIISAGKRNDKSNDNIERISASNMRNFVKSNDYNSFHNNLPTNLKNNKNYSQEIFNDVKKNLKG